MTRALVIADASPLIALHQIGELGLLQALYGEVILPPAVAQEVAVSVPLPPWLRVQELTQPIPEDVSAAGLGPGETEAISLALEVDAHLLLADDRRAWRLAGRLALPVAGTLAVLVAARQRGLVPSVGDCLRRLVDEHHFWVSPEVVATVLRRAGEG
jgi:uncharacterized protein